MSIQVAVCLALGLDTMFQNQKLLDVVLIGSICIAPHIWNFIGLERTVGIENYFFGWRGHIRRLGKSIGKVGRKYPGSRNVVGGWFE